MLERRKAKLNNEKSENNISDQKEDVHIEGQKVDHETDSVENDFSESDEVNEYEATAEESDEKLEVLQKELSESKDKYIRLAAEFDNYRKRTVREKMEMVQTAGMTLLKDILPFVDDFERGIEASANAEDMNAVRTGMGLIYSKLNEFLANHHVKEIKAINEPFNADLHEAITRFPAPTDDMKGKIVDVIQKGYTLNDKIIRYPKVVVGE